ncbi:MAG: hypothetical protein ACR2PT_08525 [Endozoicomonas sp.]
MNIKGNLDSLITNRAFQPQRPNSHQRAQRLTPIPRNSNHASLFMNSENEAESNHRQYGRMLGDTISTIGKIGQKTSSNLRGKAVGIAVHLAGKTISKGLS